MLPFVRFHRDTTNDWAHRLERATLEIDLGAPWHVFSRHRARSPQVVCDPIEFEWVHAIVNLCGLRKHTPIDGRAIQR